MQFSLVRANTDYLSAVTPKPTARGGRPAPELLWWMGPFTRARSTGALSLQRLCCLPT